jgi:hypothetical protein
VWEQMYLCRVGHVHERWADGLSVCGAPGDGKVDSEVLERFGGREQLVPRKVVGCPRLCRRWVTTGRQRRRCVANRLAVHLLAVVPGAISGNACTSRRLAGRRVVVHLAVVASGVCGSPRQSLRAVLRAVGLSACARVDIGGADGDRLSVATAVGLSACAGVVGWVLQLAVLAAVAVRLGWRRRLMISTVLSCSPLRGVAASDRSQSDTCACDDVSSGQPYKHAVKMKMREEVPGGWAPL